MVDALGNCLHLVPMPGQWADLCSYRPCWRPCATRPGLTVADRAYDANAVFQAIACRQAKSVIVPRTSRNEPRRTYNRNLYADRNKAEWFCGCLKEARGFATRYDKTTTAFLAAAHLPAALNWLR